MEDTAWLSTSFSGWINDRTGGQAMPYFTCITIPSIDLARYGVSRVKDLGIWKMWYKVVSVTS